MKVHELMRQLVDVDQNLDVFIVRNVEQNKDVKGVYLVYTEVKGESLPKNCLVIER